MSAAYDPIAAAELRGRFVAGSNGHHADDTEGVAPVFPIEIFPPAFREYAERASAAVPVPVEMVAIPMMGIAASVIGNRAHLHLKRTWQEYASFFFACVADPGKAKSGAQGLAEEPMRMLQRAAGRQHREDVRVHQEIVRGNKARPKGEQIDDPPYPIKREYYTTDITIEALARVLEHSPGVVYSGDEFAAWVERMNQYRKGGDREQYMSIWAGRPIKATRKTVGASVEVDKPVVCVIGGVQPEVVPHLMSEARDGFVERILPYVPLVSTKTWNRRSTSEREEWDVFDLFRAIDTLPMINPDDEAMHPGVAVAMSQEAEASWAGWYDENNALAAEVKGILGGFYSKLEAHVARFALVLHVLWHPDDPRLMVGEETMRHAIVLGEWFRQQIDLFIPMLGKDLVPAGVSAGLAQRLKSFYLCVDARYPGKDGWVTKLEIRRHIYRVKTDELLLLLDTWIDLGVLESRPVTPSGSGRRGIEYRLVEKKNGASINKKKDYCHVPWEES